MVAFTGAGSLVGQEGAQAPREDVVSAVFSDWQRRSEAVVTAKFKWTETITYAKGSLPYMSKGGAAQGPTPPTDVSHKTEMALALKRDLMRLTRNGEMWSANEGIFLPGNYLSTFDGTHSRGFYDNPGKKNQKLGSENPDKHFPDVTNYDVWPILFTYRATSPVLPYFGSKGDWKFGGQHGTAQGRDCLILERLKEGAKYSCWVDTERASLILRFIVQTGDRIVQVDTTYQQSRGGQWGPANRTRIDMNGVKLVTRQSANARVAEQEINPPIQDDFFRFEFPVGTEVTDSTHQPIKTYLVVADGNNRYITEQERLKAANREQLLETIQPSPSIIWPLIVSVLSAGAFMFIVYRTVLVLRHRKKTG